MNFIQLVSRLSVECGEAGNGPLTTVGQTGMAGNLVNWINAAWIDIQAASQDWEWLRKGASCVTIAGTPNYAPTGTAGFGLSDFGMWDQDTFRSYVTSVGAASEMFLDKMGYDDWRNTYYFNANRSILTRPVNIAVAWDKSIVLGPIPDVGYTITGIYYSAPVSMALDGDIPTLPAQFHLGIVYRAMMFYGLFQSANEVYERGDAEFSKMMARLNIDQLPPCNFIGTLA